MVAATPPYSDTKTNWWNNWNVWDNELAMKSLLKIIMEVSTNRKIMEFICL